MSPFTQLDLLKYSVLGAYERLLPDTAGPIRYVHESIGAWRIEQGELRVCYEDGVEESYRAGVWVFPRGVPGRQHFSGGLRLVSIRFAAEWAFGVPLFPRGTTISIPMEEAPALTRAARALVKVFEREVRPCGGGRFMGSLPVYWKVQERFFHWLRALEEAFAEHHHPIPPPQAMDREVRQMLDWIESLPPGATLRMHSLAERCGGSVSRLSRLFSRQIGMSPVAYWQRCRLEEARRKLLNGAQSIKETAYGLGFSSPEHFTAWFRKHHGTSPTALRESRQKGDAGFV